MGPGPSWRLRVLGAVAVVLAVAVGTRLAASLLSPYVPYLMVGALLLAVYVVALRHH